MNKTYKRISNYFAWELKKEQQPPVLKTRSYGINRDNGKRTYRRWYL